MDKLFNFPKEAKMFGITFLVRKNSGDDAQDYKLGIMADSREEAFAKAHEYAKAENWSFYKIWSVVTI